MNCEEIREKIYDLVFDLLDEEERREVEAHLATCDACREARDAALRERALLRRWVVPAPPVGLADAAVAAAKRKEARVPSYQPIEPELKWLGSRRFWKVVAAAVVLIAGAVLLDLARVSMRRADPQEAFLYGQAHLTPGVRTAFRVFVRNGARGTPIPNAHVRLVLMNNQRRGVWTWTAKSDENGFVEVEPEVPADAPEGSYTLRVDASSADGESVIERAVEVKRSFRIMVTTDKPLYQPGQVIRIRTLALATADLRPVGGRDIVIEVKDAKGNKVFKKKTRMSAFGIASADFELADQVNVGSYTVSATIGDTTSEREVRVERYRLPKFKIALTTDKGYYMPGAKVSGDLVARYTFGEPVAGGKVRVVASEFIERFRPFATAEGETDAEGRFHFEIPLKDHFVGQERTKGDAFVTLEATVIDTADHTQKKALDLTVTNDPIRIELFPESGTLVQNVENILYVVTAYPDGRPAKTKLTIGATRKAVETSALGIAKVKITPKSEYLQLTVSAEDAKGVRTTVTRRLRVGTPTESLLLRTDRVVYRAGGTAKMTVLSADRVGRVFLDVVKDRRTLLMKALDVKDGKGELALDLPPDLFGTLELHAYRIMRDGNIVGDTRVIQVNRADDLAISAELDKETYRPAERALLKFIVKRANGDPTHAALSLSGVDEAVFALAEMRPGLERIYFALQEEILKPRYEICAHAPVTPAQAIQPPPEPEPEFEEATVVLFSAAEGGEPPQRQASASFDEKIEQVRHEKARHLAAVETAGALAVFALFVLCTLPILGYAVLKLFRQAPVEGLSVSERRELLDGTRNVMICWVPGMYLLLIAVVTGANPGVCGALGFLTSVLLAISVYPLCTREVAEVLPLLRKVALTLPLAFLFAAIATAFIVAAAQARPELLSASATVTLLVVTGLLGLAVVGALSIAGHCAVEHVSMERCIGLGLSRPLLATLPALVLAAVLLPGLARSRGEARRRRGPAPKGALGFIDSSISMAAPEMPSDVKVPTAQLVEPGGLKAPARVRRHFPETLLWRPELITDDAGRAQLEVPLADSITTWRIAMSAVSPRGELGAATKGLRVFQDFFVDIDFPVALTQHDLISVPVAVYNYLDEEQTVRLEVQPDSWFELKDSSSKTLRIGPKRVTSVYFPIEAKTPGRHSLTVKAHGSQLADAVERKVIVEPDGQPVIQTINGRLSENLIREIVIPDEAIDGASDLIVKIYPGAFSQVVEGLESIFRMPYGCFEQTSSTTYPNVLVLNYLRRTNQAKPQIEMKALNYINLGYQRLLSFEVAGGGFSLYGKPPASPALTAYGLMEFQDMAKVHDVDPAVIRRTRDWLFSQQREDGTWGTGHRGPATTPLATTAYIAWALAESGESDRRLARSLSLLARGAGQTKDAYTLALCANALIAGKHPKAGELIDRLESMEVAKDKLLRWTSSSEGVTWSRGSVLDIETTALAAYALLQARLHTDVAHKALAWLIEQKDPHGTWHSTQATVLAMRALLAGAGTSGGVEGDVHVTISANSELAKELTITPETSDVFRLISLRELLREGTNRVALEAAGKGNLAYQIVATHYVPWPKEKPRAEKELTIDLRYNTTTLKKDDILTCGVTIRYNRPGPANMVIVDLGIPPGFDVLPDAFESLKKQEVIERYSITGRQVILYFSGIAGRKPVTFTYRLRAKFPVRAKTPRSTVYKYYEPAVRDVAAPVELNVL